jgi:S-adenosylmethionine hydrolase
VARPIVFLSDLGLRDEFVGVCHSVIARIAPEARVVDLSHGVPPADVSLGALVLAECVAYAPADAVFLGVVDPGVGTGRRAIAVQTVGDRLLVGPDNGLLSLAWEDLGGAGAAFEITSEEFIVSPVSTVFHGRDIFAPAAAHLAAGVPAEDVGPAVDPESLVRLTLPEPEVDDGVVRCQALDVDRFGNVRLNVRPAHLEAAGLGEEPVVLIGSPAASATARRVSTYSGVGLGEYGLIVDAWGWVTVCRFEASAGEGLMVGRDDVVWIGRPDVR